MEQQEPVHLGVLVLEVITLVLEMEYLGKVMLEVWLALAEAEAEAVLVQLD